MVKPFVYKYKDRFRAQPAINPSSILWQLIQEGADERRAHVLQETGRLFDMPNWLATKD